MQHVYVAGIGMTKFGRDPRSLAEICRDAAKQALATSPVQEIEAIYIGVMNSEEFTGDSNIASLLPMLWDSPVSRRCGSRPRLRQAQRRSSRFSGHRVRLLPPHSGPWRRKNDPSQYQRDHSNTGRCHRQRRTPVRRDYAGFGGDDHGKISATLSDFRILAWKTCCAVWQ